MKTIILSVLLLVSYSVSIAQDWCHQGSKWSYTVSFWGQYNNIVQYTYNKDTLLSNHICHQLIDTTYNISFQNNSYILDNIVTDKAIYTYSSTDSVYLFDYTQNRWNPRYFFNVQTGDTIRISNYSFYGFDTVVTALIDTSGIMLIDTNHLRYYSFHLLDSCDAGSSSGTVVERIGIINNSMDPTWQCITDGTYWNLCSYQDDSFIAYPTSGCPMLVSGINAITSISFQIQPNPAQDEISVNIDANMIGVSMSIADVDGRSLVKTQLNSTDNNISVSDLANGIYLLTISENGRQGVSRKLVIAR